MLAEKVYSQLRKIPKGKVTTYGALAKKFKTSPRAIGKIMSSNTTTAPCHRVIMSDGKIGGYNKGVKAKIKILKKEGLIIKNNKIVNEQIIKTIE